MTTQSLFRKISIAICLLISLSQTPQAQINTISNKSQALLDEIILFEESIGVSAGILMNDEIEWVGAVGYQDLENRIAFNIETKNRTASIAKPMTAIAILQLYEQNKLDIDDPINTYLPSFPNDSTDQITIRHLLHHNSGIRAYQSNNEAYPTSNYESLDEAINVFKNRSLQFSPGTDYLYTTYGYVVLGAIIERVSGMSFRNYMKANIWNKASMHNTDVEIYGADYPNKARLYHKQPNGEIVPGITTNLSVKVPGGGFYSTTKDLLSFGQAILNNVLIKPETFDIMMTDPGTKSRGNPYLMGWFQYGDKSSKNGLTIGHSGSQSGTSTQLMIHLEKKIVVVVLANTSGVWNNIFDLTIKLSENAMYPELLKQTLPQIISITDSILDNYVGSYQSNEEAVRRIQKIDGDLYVFLNNNISYRMYSTAKNIFFIRRAGITIDFVENEKTKSYDLVINDNGEKYTYSKI
ncbi:MAG: hypothetical protein BalsKO_24380 [Balneolaceae bacterium]